MQTLPENPITPAVTNVTPSPATVQTPSGKIPAVKIFIALVMILVLGAAGIGGYIIMNIVNLPPKIKERAVTVQTVFEDYSKNIEQIAHDLKDETGSSDSDSLERSVQKSVGLVKTAETNLKTLTPLVANLDTGIKELTDYKNNISDYVTKSDQLVNIAKESNKLGTEYIEPLKKYEKLTVGVSGVSNIMFSDPEKYSAVISAAITEEKSIADTIKAIQVSGNFKSMTEALAASIESERTLLEQIVTAVNKRSSSDIATATQNYTAAQQDNSKSISRIKDRIYTEIDDSVSQLDTSKTKVNNEYSFLRNKYGF